MDGTNGNVTLQLSYGKLKVTIADVLRNRNKMSARFDRAARHVILKSSPLAPEKTKLSKFDIHRKLDGRSISR